MEKGFLHKIKNSYFKTCAKVFDFKGRSTRFDFLSYHLTNFIGIFVASKFSGELAFFLSLVSFLPALSLAIRRLHDTNHSGAHLLFGFLPFFNICLGLYLLLAKSDLNKNKYGLPDPSILKKYKIFFSLNEQGNPDFDFGFKTTSTGFPEIKKEIEGNSSEAKR